MVSITLSIPEEVRAKMNGFGEINWSGFIRNCIMKKVEELNSKEEMLKELNKDKEIIALTVDLGRKAKLGRVEELKNKGLI